MHLVIKSDGVCVYLKGEGQLNYDFQGIEKEQLITAIREVCKEQDLIAMETQEKKILELHEQVYC